MEESKSAFEPGRRWVFQQVLDLLDEGKADGIAATIRKHARWNMRQQRQFAHAAPEASARTYVSGESFRYLGRQYRLKVQAGERATVRLQRGLLLVTVPPEGGADQVRRALSR